MIIEADNSQAANWPGEVRADTRAMGNITVDCVVLRFDKGRIKYLIQEFNTGTNAGKWALPGGWVLLNESLDDAASRHLKEVSGAENAYVEQLKAFGNTNRVDDRRVITVAYFVFLRGDQSELLEQENEAKLVWRDVEDQRNFILDHDDIVVETLGAVRHKVRHEPIVFHLLPEKFTLLQLQELYEAILGIKLDKPNFRRKMMKMNLLVSCGEKQQNVAHRAAELYRFDQESYLERHRQGFRYEV